MEVPSISGKSQAFLRMAWIMKRQVSDETYAAMFQDALSALQEEDLPEPPAGWISQSMALLAATTHPKSMAGQNYGRTSSALRTLVGEAAALQGVKPSFAKEMADVFNDWAGHGARLLDHFEEMNRIKPRHPLTALHFVMVNLLRTEAQWVTAMFNFYNLTANGDAAWGQDQERLANSMREQAALHYEVLSEALRNLKHKHPRILDSMELSAKQLAELS